MPYAGFDNLTAYIDDRCARDRITRAALSVRLGKHDNYVHCICNGQFTPSAKMADALAEFFGDDPHVPRVLAGLETPPPTGRRLREIADLASALSTSGQDKLIEYAQFLRWRERK